MGPAWYEGTPYFHRPKFPNTFPELSVLPVLAAAYCQTTQKGIPKALQKSFSPGNRLPRCFKTLILRNQAKVSRDPCVYFRKTFFHENRHENDILVEERRSISGSFVTCCKATKFAATQQALKN